MTQFADFGKIFAAKSKAILLLKKAKYNYLSVKDWLENLQKLSPGLTQKESLGQKRYNGHLANNFQKAIQYFQQLEQVKPEKLSDIRNKVVRDIFRIMRGEPDVNP